MDRLLFWSGSIGLGHVTRDIAIAKKIRELNPGIQIDWLAGDPARSFLRDAGETVLSESEGMDNGSGMASSMSSGHSFDLAKWSMGVLKAWARNAEIYGEAVSKKDYDIAIGDETFELPSAVKKHPQLASQSFILMYDYLGVHALSWNPIERLVVRKYNSLWARSASQEGNYKSIFIGERSDIPDERFGLLLPRKNVVADKACEFVGYVVDFDPSQLPRQVELKKGLGYAEGPLLVCSIGGTAVGRDLLDITSQAFSRVKDKIPGAQLALICGPGIDPSTVPAGDGIIVKGCVPNLWKHYAASDLAVIVGGGTSTIELTALQKPFIYFPLEGHHEQQGAVAERCARYRAGVRMSFSRSTPEILAEAMLANLGKKVAYPPMPVDGALQAARYITTVGGANHG